MRIVVAILVGANIVVFFWGIWQSVSPAGNHQPQTTIRAVTSPGCANSRGVDRRGRIRVGPFNTLRAVKTALPRVRRQTGRNAVLASTGPANVIVIPKVAFTAIPQLREDLRAAGYHVLSAGFGALGDCRALPE